MNIDRQTYLQRPLIEGAVYEISEKKIKIITDCTCFIELSKREKVPLTEVEKVFRELKKAAKNSGKVKLKGVTKFLPAVRSLYPAYCDEFDKEEKLFRKILDTAYMIKKDGLHMGCDDDEYLKIIYGAKSEILKLHYRSSNTSHFLEYYYTIKDILNRKKWEKEDIVNCSYQIA